MASFANMIMLCNKYGLSPFTFLSYPVHIFIGQTKPLLPTACNY